jgi:hypothetical protein
MQICYRVAALRREVEKFVALAERRASRAESPHAAPTFRPLRKPKTAAMLGELLAVLATGNGVPKS